jgi:uncharacterized protein YcbX
MDLRLASLHLYPIKSLGGMAVERCTLSDRGLQHDRRWMLVDAAGRFVSQRELPVMALLWTEVVHDGFRVRDVRDGSHLDLPWTLEASSSRMCSVWSDRVRCIPAPAQWDVWFSERCGTAVHLVYQPERTRRRTDGRYAKALTSLSDGFPYLVVNAASLRDLNERGRQVHGAAWVPVAMDRFRPNLVIDGAAPWAEDGWASVTVGGMHFDLVKPCARCVIVNTDQATAARHTEPLRTLATFRTKGNKVLFGMNAVGAEAGSVQVGDLVTAMTSAPRP